MIHPVVMEEIEVATRRRVLRIFDVGTRDNHLVSVALHAQSHFRRATHFPVAAYEISSPSILVRIASLPAAVAEEETMTAFRRGLCRRFWTLNDFLDQDADFHATRLADPAAHDRQRVFSACQIVTDPTSDPRDRQEAHDLMSDPDGPAACLQHAGSLEDCLAFAEALVGPLPDGFRPDPAPRPALAA
jgi:hypothetical protein